jgi:hypothetical protein
MPPDIQTIPSNYYVSQYPFTNNTDTTAVCKSDMFMPISAFAQRPNLPSLAENIQSPNTFSNIQSVSCPALSNLKNTSLPTLPTWSARTPLPPFKHSDDMLYLNSSHSDVPQPNSKAISGMESDLCHQHTVELPQMLRFDFASTVTQETDYNLLAESALGEHSNVATKQAMYKIMPETFVHPEQETWLQQEQQHIQPQELKQYEEKQLLEFMKNVQQLNTELTQEDLERSDIPLPPLQNFQETETLPTQTASTVVDVQFQEGKQVMLLSKLLLCA